MNTKKLIRSSATLLLCSPLFAGCILTTGNDDAGIDDDGDSNNSSVSDTDVSDDDSGSPQSDTLDDDDSSGDDSSNVDDTGGTTDGPTGECSETRIVDGGFEAGTPSAAWTEASQQFGSPICDTTCTEEEGAGPYAGDWYAWYGGIADAEQASVSQTVTLDGDSAFLSFRFEINASAGTGDDVFSVTIDGETVFMATDLEIEDYASYTPISIDVSDFIDGGEHVIALSSDHAGTGMTSFFLDEVALAICDEGGEESGSSSGEDSGTTAADESESGGSSDDSGSSDDGGSSSDGGSSGSTGM